MEGVVRHFPDWWRRPSPIKHLRSEPGQPELHTEGTAFGSGQPIRFLFRPRDALSSASLTSRQICMAV